MTDFLVIFSTFVKLKLTVNENVSFIIYASGIRLPDCSKLAINRKNYNDVTNFQICIDFVWPCSISLVKFIFWPRFQVNLMTGVTTIFVYKESIRNLEIVNTPVWVLHNIWRVGEVRDTEFGTNVSNKMLLIAYKFQVYSFYRCWLIKGKPTGER